MPMIRLPDEVFSCHLRVGLVPRADHCQLQLEVSDPRTDELLALTSRPHVRIADLRPELLSMTEQLLAYTSLLLEPF